MPLKQQFQHPPPHRREVQAAVRAGGFRRDQTIADAAFVVVRFESYSVYVGLLNVRA